MKRAKNVWKRSRINGYRYFLLRER